MSDHEFVRALLSHKIQKKDSNELAKLVICDAEEFQPSLSQRLLLKAYGL